MRFLAVCLVILTTMSALGQDDDGTNLDPRDLRAGLPIPDEGYCDMPYTVITADGNWLCLMTTGVGTEGKPGQHIVATISPDQGRSWSDAVDIEPADGPEASWAMPLVVPSGRVYCFYTYNGDTLRTWKDKPLRADMLGWYCYKYSDDHGRSWSQRRYRLPLPLAPVDRTNTFGGQHQIFWGIGKPITIGDSAWFAFTRCGKLLVDRSEGWFFRSDNILSEPDVDKLQWRLLPDGDQGMKNPQFGEIHAEHNLVALGDGSLYCMYRTTTGHPFHAYSRDGGHTWTQPLPATYSPDGRRMKTPRACPRIWRTANGNFLFWYHNHSDVDAGGWTQRNPAWIAGGVERDGMIHWSQPEILLYDRDVDVRTSYPDLIEQDGRYWITETQKSIARVHEIDAALLEGLWAQGERKNVAREGLVLDVAPGETEDPSSLRPAAQTLNVADSGGLTVELWLKLDDLTPGETLVDSRLVDGEGPAITLTTTERGAIRVDATDGVREASWDCDRGLLRVGELHHVVAIFDAGPGIISFLVDGRLCDGGDARSHGWARYDAALSNVLGADPFRLAASVVRLRLYNRYLRTSEAISNYHAGP